MSKEKSYRSLRVILGWYSFFLLLIGGCGGGDFLTEAEMKRVAVTERIKLTEDAGGLVLIVGGETITSDEILNSRVEYEDKIIPLKERIELLGLNEDMDDPEKYKKQARPYVEKVLKAEISDILLYQLAKRQAGGDVNAALDKVAEKEFRKFALTFRGDKAKAEKALKELGLDRRGYIEEQKRLILVRQYATSKLPRDKPVTYRELKTGYDRMKDDFFAIKASLRFLLLDVDIVRLKIADPNQAPSELADKLFLEMEKSPDDDFGKLAEKHPGVFFIDHSKGVQPESLVEPYDILVLEADKIKPGKIAGQIKTERNILIMKLLENRKGGYKPFAQVQREVEKKIIKARQNEFLNRFNEELLRQAELSETDKFVDFCLDKLYEMSSR